MSSRLRCCCINETAARLDCTVLRTTAADQKPGRCSSQCGHAQLHSRPAQSAAMQHEATGGRKLHSKVRAGGPARRCHADTRHDKLIVALRPAALYCSSCMRAHRRIGQAHVLQDVRVQGQVEGILLVHFVIFIRVNGAAAVLVAGRGSGSRFRGAGAGGLGAGASCWRAGGRRGARTCSRWWATAGWLPRAPAQGFRAQMQGRSSCDKLCSEHL